METVRLTAGYAEKIAALEQAVYPPEFLSGVSVIRENLLNAERADENLSLGILDGEELMAYLIAWVTYSLIERRSQEEVIFIDDIVVLKGHVNAFFDLLQALRDYLIEKKLTHLPIEGTTREGSFKVFASHKRIFDELGYTLVGTHEYWDEELCENLTFVRFHPSESVGENESSEEPVEEAAEENIG